MKKLLILIMALAFFSRHSATGQGQSNSYSPNEEKISAQEGKGKFFLTPFFQYTHFQNLKLVSHVNTYKLWEGESLYTYNAQEINAYNDLYQTRYSQSMTGIRLGYQAAEGLGVTIYAGINHFTFYSWEGFGNTQTSSTEYPALTTGITLDYKKAFPGNLIALAFLSGNLCSTKSILLSNSSGEEVISSRLYSMFWDASLAVGYNKHKLIPYVGTGVSQQFIRNQSIEKILTEDDQGLPFYNQTQFDTKYQGLGIYCFAGLDYHVSEHYSFYIRGCIPNPERFTTGVRINL